MALKLFLPLNVSSPTFPDGDEFLEKQITSEKVVLKLIYYKHLISLVNLCD